MSKISRAFHGDPGLPPSTVPLAKPAPVSLGTNENKDKRAATDRPISSPRASALRASVLPAPVSALWKRLRRAAVEFSRNFKARTSGDAEAKINANTVQVHFSNNGARTLQPIDAVMVKVTRLCNSWQRQNKPVQLDFPFGKSPDEMSMAAHYAECERSLVQGMTSGQGVYQFVSRKAHFHPGESREKPIIGTLQAQWKSSKDSHAGLILGGRFRVVSIDPEVSPTPMKMGPEYHADDMHRTCQVTVIDIDDRDAQHRVIPLTQVGLKFTDKLLRVNQIEHAHQILTDHLKTCETALPDAQAQSLPLIASLAKRGRGPTLIVFHEIVTRIKAGLVTTENAIDEALSNIISLGREARIAKDIQERCEPDLDGFVHSDRQLQELREALHNALVTKKAIDDHQMGYGVGNLATDALDQSRFDIRENKGGGNCLFHALEGTDLKPDLTREEVDAVRDRVAKVLEGQKDTPEGMRRNALEVNTESGLPGPEKVSNADMAKLQRSGGYVAGAMEIEQWLALPENADKTVICIDAQIDYEAIQTFTPGKREHIYLNQLAVDENRSNTDITAHLNQLINTAVHGDNVQYRNAKPIIPENRIVLYRTTGHFARITEIKTETQVAEDLAINNWT